MPITHDSPNSVSLLNVEGASKCLRNDFIIVNFLERSNGPNISEKCVKKLKINQKFVFSLSRDAAAQWARISLSIIARECNLKEIYIESLEWNAAVKQEKAVKRAR